MDLENKAYDALLAHWVDAQLKASKINLIINHIDVAQPEARDDIVRAPFIPEVKGKKKYDKNSLDRMMVLGDSECSISI